MAKPPEEFSVFDALRDTIYSEVATLIANNENRPHYLVELFRELQMLSSDYLRQRALYSLQNLVTRYLTEESLQQRQREGGTEHDTTVSSEVHVPGRLLSVILHPCAGSASVGGVRADPQ